MGEEIRIGVYLGQVGFGVASTINVQAVAEYAESLPGVVQVKVLGIRPKIDPVALTREIERIRLDRVIVAGDTPGYFKSAFTRAMAQAGRDPEQVELASFRGHGVDGPNATDRAKGIVLCAVLGVPFSRAATPAATPVHPDTLVIGGGVAGIQASLEIAAAGKKVYLVEKTGTIGGHMAMFDKTFPTLDCAACILTPKMVAVGQNELIDLMTCSEVTEVLGSPGAFRVKVLRRARRVDETACVACNLCSDVCPVSVPSEFDQGVTTRKAIYLPFPQAVPNAFLIDADACLYIQSNGQKCGACAKKCAKEGIHFDAQDEVVELEVGNIIVANGYDIFDARRIERYGFGVHPNVLTALEFERLTNASGPTGGRIVLKTLKHNKRKKVDEWVFAPEGPQPRSVAIIHCVGSRDQNYNSYCSRVCCMYSLKFAHLVREKLPEAACYEFYIDMRSFGKNYESFFERIRDEGVFVVRGRTAKVDAQDGQLVVKGEDIVGERLLNFPVDMVILSVGLEPTADAGRLADMLGLRRDEDGWFQEVEYNTDPTGTERGGVYVAGVCQGPKDIPDAVAQASAVAAQVLSTIVSGRGHGSRGGVTLAQIEEQVRRLAQA